jgi:uncharacterized protein YqeY
MLIEEIKKANVEAMKNKDANMRSIYSVLINKHLQATINARTSGGPVGDEEMIKIIQKTIKELDEEAENYRKVNHTAEVEKIEAQKKAIEKYLPQMMSEEEVKAIIDAMEDKSIPSVMKHFKANYAGKVDMSLVNKIARN